MFKSDDEFLERSREVYDNIQSVSIDDFYEDISRINLVRKMLSTYARSGRINERLILNHIIILFNVFGSDTNNLLYYKVPEASHKYLTAFLIFLNRVPEKDIGRFPTDNDILERLRQL